MDYGELLYKAQALQRTTANQEVRCYKTSFGPPKKLERTVSSANVKKFLARKEDEEKKKQLEALKKKEELLALRQQDKKAKRRVESMLKRTKSANKSVMEDAIDNNNTADTLCGPMQCDEDDYGYVSQEASAFYAKLMNKYNNMPPEPSPFSEAKKEVKDLSAAKARVKAALRKEEEEAELPHKRKKKHKDSDQEGKEDIKGTEEKESFAGVDKKGGGGKVKASEPPLPEKKKKISAPPPPSFEQILKMAEQKKSQFIDFEKIIRKNAVASKEPERPMTQKEKQEWQRQQELKINRERREKGLPPLPTSSKVQDNSVDTTLASKRSKGELKSEGVRKSSTTTAKTSIKEPQPSSDASSAGKIKRIELPKPSSSIAEGGSCRLPSTEKKLDKRPSQAVAPSPPTADIDEIDREIELLRKKKMLLEKSRAAASQASSVSQQHNRPSAADSNTTRKVSSSLPSQKSSNERPSKPYCNSTSNHPPRQGPKGLPTAVRKEPRLAGSSQPTKPSHLPPMKPKKPLSGSKLAKPVKRRIDSESEEYDSELDDFIDDGDDNLEQEELSSVLRTVFGYDKSKYGNVVDDDECMESNFAQQMREEFVSTKIGIMEDLEDIRKEQEEKRRLKLKKLKGGKVK